MLFKYLWCPAFACLSFASCQTATIDKDDLGTLPASFNAAGIILEVLVRNCDNRAIEKAAVTITDVLPDTRPDGLLDKKPRREQVTDAAGVALFRLPPEREYDIEARYGKEDEIIRTRRIFLGGATRLMIPLATEPTLVGRVVSREGLPLGETYVSIYTVEESSSLSLSRQVVRAQADENGYFIAETRGIGQTAVFRKYLSSSRLLIGKVEFGKYDSTMKDMIQDIGNITLDADKNRVSGWVQYEGAIVPDSKVTLWLDAFVFDVETDEQGRFLYQGAWKTTDVILNTGAPGMETAKVLDPDILFSQKLLVLDLKRMPMGILAFKPLPDQATNEEVFFHMLNRELDSGWRTSYMHKKWNARGEPEYFFRDGEHEPGAYLWYTYTDTMASEIQYFTLADKQEVTLTPLPLKPGFFVKVTRRTGSVDKRKIQAGVIMRLPPDQAVAPEDYATLEGYAYLRNGESFVCGPIPLSEFRASEVLVVFPDDDRPETRRFYSVTEHSSSAALSPGETVEVVIEE